MYFSLSSQCGVWLDSANVYHLTFGIALNSGNTVLSVASSYAPLSNSVGTLILCASSSIVQVFKDPITWNSDGPFLHRHQRAIRHCCQSHEHRHVDRVVLFHPLKALQELDGPGIEPAEVALVEDLYGVFILLRVRRLSLLVLNNGVLIRRYINTRDCTRE